MRHYAITAAASAAGAGVGFAVTGAGTAGVAVAAGANVGADDPAAIVPFPLFVCFFLLLLVWVVSLST